MREMYLCVRLCVYISETYLFLTSTQWRENQTKGLEPSDTKTSLYSQRAKETSKLFVQFVQGSISNPNPNSNRAHKKRKRNKVNK